MNDFFELFLPGELVRYVPGPDRTGVVVQSTEDGLVRVRWDDNGEQSLVSATCLEIT